MTRIVSLASRTALLLFACSCLVSRAANCAEIKVMTSGGLAAPVTDLAPLFERATQNNIILVTTSMGLGRNSIPNRLRDGEVADVVLLPDADIQALINEGSVLSDTRTALANSSIGMAVRSGAPKPDIGSVDALKRTLLQAKSIAYSAQVSGQYHPTSCFHVWASPNRSRTNHSGSNENESALSLLVVKRRLGSSK